MINIPTRFDMEYLLNPQMPHSEASCRSLMENRFSLDASPTGTGKTYCTAAQLRHLKRKFIVVCPKISIPKWAAVLKQFGLKAEFILNYELVARGNLKKIYKYKTSADYHEVPDFLCGEWKIPVDWVVVMDESHRTKGVTSLNAGMVFALANQGYTVLMLSATQAMTPLDMRAFGYIAGLHKGMHLTGGRKQNWGMNNFKDFCKAAGAEYTGSYGAMYFDSSDPDARKALYDVVHKYLFEDKKCAFRMNRADFGNIFKHNQIESTPMDMGENGRKIKRVYEDMQNELAKLAERAKSYREHIFAILTEARRRAELLKVPAICEVTEDAFDEGKSILNFVNYHETVEALTQRLSKKFGDKLVGRIEGQSHQNPRERANDIDMFQKDAKRILNINVAAGSESIDLQDVTGRHPRVSNINPSYRAIAVVQAIGRPDRAHAQSDIITNMIFASGTIEESVAMKFNDKKGHLDILNDGDLIPNGIGFEVANMVGGMNI